MPPANYPITKELCRSANHKLLMLEPSSNLSTLAKLQQKPIDTYLNEVFRHLKDPFEMFHLRKIPTVTFSLSNLEWKVTIQQKVGIKRHDLKLLEALGILNYGLFQSRLLLRNISQVGEAEIKGLTKLKEFLFLLTGFLDKILIFYTNAGLNETYRPTVEEIKHVAKKSREYLMKINPEKLDHLIPNVPVKEEAILCSVLGLEEEVANRLAGLKPHIRGHQTDLYFILHFLEEHAEYSGSLTDKKAVATRLQEIGFTVNRSIVVAEWISKQPFPNHQPLYSWATDYIEKLFMYDIFLNDIVPSYPFGETEIDSWFPVSVERYKEDEKDVVEKTDVSVFNTTFDKLENKVQEKRHEFQQQHPEKCLYFHGTDHNGAQSIIEDGIKLEVGKQQCAFSDGFGFYLGTDSEFSIGWSKKNEASAIVMFDIEDCVNKYQCLHLSNGSETDLEKLMNHCQANGKLPKPLKKTYETCDYVKGPISQVELRQHQLCIRNQAMADEIGDAPNIYGVIFCYQ